MQKKQWQLKEIDKYVVVNNEIGKGNQAVIYEAYRKDNLLQVAAKVFDLTIKGNQNQTKNIQRQIQLQSALKHPYILECYDIKKTAERIYFFLEYCDGGDLEKYLRDKKFISESECLDLFKQIVSAFQMLEKINVVHRDLKPANILLKNGQLKIADFGFAKEVNPDDIKNTLVGSPIFMCPQALNGSGKYDLMKGDVWSAGVCLYLMLYGEYPFYANNIPNLIQLHQQSEIVFRDDIQQRSDAVKDLIRHMLEKNEDLRYTWTEVANHKCLNAGSQYQNNPLLGSLEINQVSCISSFNNDLKNVEIKKDNNQNPSEDANINQQQIAQQQQQQQLSLQQQVSIQQGSSVYQRRRDNILQIKQIHCILRLQSQFALIYRIIWKGYFQLLTTQSQNLVHFQDETATNAIFLLINSLLLKEHKFLRDLVNDPKKCLEYRIQKHKIPNIEEIDYIEYFNSEIFINFLCNLRNTFQNDTYVSYMSFSDQLQAQLIAAGFSEIISEEKCNQYIDLSLSILNPKIASMAEEAFQKNNRTFSILILYLFFLQNKEKRLQNFTDPIDHYQKLLQQLESINFMTKEQILQRIQQYISSDIENDNNMDDEDDDDDDDEENYEKQQLNILNNRYT